MITVASTESRGPGPLRRPRTEQYAVDRARQLLADVDTLDYADTSAAYAIIGRSQAVIEDLIRALDGDRS